ncbi:dymeclin isoform X1 [Cryptosporidium felis]|nr:dymeclin isoform X1 [Cryptosporidium felis]
MGLSISKEYENSTPKFDLNFIEAFLSEYVTTCSSVTWENFQVSFDIPINDEAKLDQTILNFISSESFDKNHKFCSLHPLFLLFIELLYDKEKELVNFLEGNNTRKSQLDQVNLLINLGMLIKIFIKHFMNSFEVDILIKSMEDLPFPDIISKSVNYGNEELNELDEIIVLSEIFPKPIEMKIEHNIMISLLLFILKSSKNSIDENSTKPRKNSILEQLFTRLISFLVLSEKIIESPNSSSEIYRLMLNIQIILMDILLTLFFHNAKEISGIQCNNFFLICFLFFSSTRNEKNIHIEDEFDDSSKNIKYLFLEYLIKKCVNNKLYSKLEIENKEKSISLLSSILFNPTAIRKNIYAEWISSISDPKFVPETLESSGSNTDSDIDNFQHGYLNFICFEQIYQSVISNHLLINQNLSILLLYSLTHSNFNFASYCLSRANPDTLILSLLEPIYVFSNRLEQNNSGKIIALLSILLRLTSDANLCKVLHITMIDSLPLWLEEESLRKRISAVNYEIPDNANYSKKYESSISVGNILVIVLLKTMFFNYKSLRDAYICKQIYSIIENISNNFQNFHWFVAEKLIQYINFLNNQIYCSFNTFNGDPTNFKFFNRFYCGLYILNTLLYLIFRGQKSELLLSNAQLIYILIRMPLISEMDRLRPFLRYCFNKYNIQSGLKINECYFSPSATELLQSILELYASIENNTRSIESELLRIDYISSIDEMHVILNIIKSIVISKDFQRNIALISNKYSNYKRCYNSEFNFFFPWIKSEVLEKFKL